MVDSLELQLVRAWVRYTEHLAGRHNQKSHANRFGSAGAIKGNVKRLGKDKEALKRMAKRARGDKDFQARVKAGAQGKKSIVDIRKRQVNGKKAGSFDEKAEREKLMTPDGKPKNGVTRDQMKRFFDRRNAVETAARSKRRGGVTVKDDLDGAIRDGMTAINKKTGGWWQLSKPDGSTTLNLKRPEEINYLLTVLNKGNFAKNY